MEIIVYLFIFILFGMLGYLMYLHAQLKRKLKEQDVAHKKELVDAGNAITETLKVAFDHLKRNSSEHNKINAKITEHSSRIHRLEQHIGRTEKSFDKRVFPSEGNVNYKNKISKNDNENENE